MRKIHFILIVITYMGMVSAFAQDSISIQVGDFDKLEGTFDTGVIDNRDANNKRCASIKINTNYHKLKIESDIKIVKGPVLINGFRYIYVAPTSQTLLFKVKDKLVEYPITLDDSDEGAVYQMSVEVYGAKDNPFYFNAGFNVLSIMGPSLAIGCSFGNYNVEAGVVYGLNSSSDHYYYQMGNSLKSAFSYKAIRAYLRGGYDFNFSGADFLTVEPQVGLAYNAIIGSKAEKADQTSDYMKNLGALSALVAVRLKFNITNNLYFHVTPEFDFGVSKNDNVKDLNSADSKIKSWTDGFNLNLGLMLYL